MKRVFTMTDAPQNTNPVPSDSDSRSVSRPSGTTVYVFSSLWLLTGLLIVLGLGAVAVGLYLYRTSNYSAHIVNVARQSFKEAGELSKKADEEKAQGRSDDEVRAIRTEAVKKKEQAANVLINYRQQQPNDSNPEVLTLLLEILDSIQADSGMTPVRRNQILDICRKLLGVVPDKDSLQYRLRILELEWDNGNLPAVVVGARDVLARTEKGGSSGRDGYPAWRYLTMAFMSQLGTIGYQPSQGDSGPTLPASIDELLDKVHRMKPEDIEISGYYADFVKDATRKEYRDASSADFRKITDAERDKKAMSIIDGMVSRNDENSRAYLVRYRFKGKFDLLGKENDKLDPDLEKVLQLDPDDPEGLILAGLHAFQQSFGARRDGDTKLAEERKTAAENYFRQTIKSNPENSVGYQHLGDFYLNEGKLAEAVQVWEECLKKNPSTNQEVIGRLVVGYIESKKLDSAVETIGLLENVIKEYRIGNPRLVSRVQNLVKLLSARLYNAQGAEAVTKADAATGAGNIEEAKKFYAIAQKKYSDASQILNQAFISFGKSPYDYVVDPMSIHSRIISESLMLAGRLAMDRMEWDVAASYFQKASKFIRHRDQAALLAANAYLQMNLPSEATDVLAEAVQLSPDNVNLRTHYAQNLFRREMAVADPGARNLDAVEAQFKILAEHKDQVSRPWTVDFRLVQLEMIRESSSLDGERSIKAVQTAVRKFKALESAEFPTPSVENDDESPIKEKEAPPKKYSDDLNFLADLAGIYSMLAQESEFDRILETIRDFPEGEPVYFERRIADALQRNDTEGALVIIEGALDSVRLTSAQKQTFVVMAQTLKDDQPKSLDTLYKKLRDTFDLNPDSLKPQVFFLMGNMALDRDDAEYAERLEKHLFAVEGEAGTMWRYIKTRRLLIEKDPPMDAVKQLLQEILDRRPDWDMTYTLKAVIEEKQLLLTPEDKELKRNLIDSYRQSIRCGNAQPVVWNRLLYLMEDLEMFDDVRKLQQDALARGVRMNTAPGQFPRPYQQLYAQAHAAILNQDQQQADLAGKECIATAQRRRENTELIYALNLGFGKLYLDNNMTDSAKRHLTEVAKLGGSFVYPLAVCLAKDKQVDKGFSLILDEIDRTPSALQVLLPSLLVLLAQVRPSETILERIDEIVVRLEKGERYVLHGEVETAGPENIVDFGVKRIQTMTVRFPDSDVVPKPETLTILPPATAE